MNHELIVTFQVSGLAPLHGDKCSAEYLFPNPAQTALTRNRVGPARWRDGECHDPWRNVMGLLTTVGEAPFSLPAAQSARAASTGAVEMTLYASFVFRDPQAPGINSAYRRWFQRRAHPVRQREPKQPSEGVIWPPSGNRRPSIAAPDPA